MGCKKLCMNKRKLAWDPLPKEKRQAYLNNIVVWFAENRDEDIGVIAAEELLDFFMEGIGQDLYKKGIEDSKKLLRSRFDDLALDLDMQIEGR